jgi:hypothetical protein
MVDYDEMLERAQETMGGKKTDRLQKRKKKAMSASHMIVTNPGAFNPAFHQTNLEGSFNTTPYEQAASGAIGGAGDMITGAGRWTGERLYDAGAGVRQWGEGLFAPRYMKAGKKKGKKRDR